MTNIIILLITSLLLFVVSLVLISLGKGVQIDDIEILNKDTLKGIVLMSGINLFLIISELLKNIL